VTITGTGSEDITTKWTNTKYLSVGYSGSSNTLSISAGGDVTNVDGFIGYNFTSGHNGVTITGTGSNDTSTKWTSSGDLFVGYLGSSNTLSISAGADVSNATGYIGAGYYKDASYGCGNGATITGAGSTWTNSGNLNVGDYGSNNTFSISDGAVVSNINGYIGGQTTGNSNHVTITGRGLNDTSTKWTNSGELTIGYFGSSNTLSISAGADVTSTNGYIGCGYSQIASYGCGNGVTITGKGSTWTNSGNLKVGDYGSNNALSISDGAVVSNINGCIGGQTTGNSNSVAITGAGSTWINSGSLTIGLTTNTGNTLTIDDGALVKVGDASGEVLTINVDSDSLNYVKLGSGCLALYGYVTTKSGNGTITALLSGIEVYNSATKTWSVVTSASALSITYYTTAEEALAEAATGYSGLAGYTVITSAVPEPATYALLGAFGALALVLVRRKKHA
jgi:T5SS/PEP-CTERM-associated repeat protein